MKGARAFPGVEYAAGISGDIYLGKPEALIAAGLLTAEHIPGWPGMPPTSATFFDGARVDRRQRVPHDERWMHALRYGNNIRLTKGISAEEKRRREEALRAEIEEEDRNQPKTDIGMDAALKAFNDASTLFKVGDKVRVGDKPAVVTGEYQLRRVRSSDGEFFDAAKGYRVDYRPGYTVQYRNGEEFFFAAGYLSDEDDAPTHLRLVAGRSTQAARPMMEFRERERM
ncbi:hypothetical protein C7T35_15280 [Variovorax sp. WS11]|uniref:hypothetical protein n=1 Tax=Variovorax sp. WS11 TaxID=1105204 RepID=UPI000D0D97C9|nr:hypothetical protein [Variovorax sp. WS11]NDZ12076.1 hypothetical protein [Variovorax sp. WS11]PSL83743.1 hypothetical protein C7T35_15280 [Variovorax sp. WS11]